MKKETTTEPKGLDFYPPYVSPTGDALPICAHLFTHGSTFSWPVSGEPKPDENFTSHVPGEPEDTADMDDRQNLLNAVAAGCNVGFKGIDLSDKKKLLTFAAYKCGLFISNAMLGESGENCDSFIGDLKPNSDKKYKVAAIGFHLEDEPDLDALIEPDKAGVSDTAWMDKGYEPKGLLATYRRLANKIRETPGWNALIDINLVPIHGFGNKDGTSSAQKYQEYLDTYERLYHPAYYSYDQYPVMQFRPSVSSKGFFGTFCNLRPGSYVQSHESFYRSMEMVASQARRHNRPFWAFLMTGEHIFGGAIFPMARESHLRYEAFTALAYGARGLQLFNFIQNHDDQNNLDQSKEAVGDDWRESYMRHPLSEDRRRTPAWYYLRRVINEIRKYEKIFLKCTHKGVWHTHQDRLLNHAKEHYPFDAAANDPIKLGIRFGFPLEEGTANEQTGNFSWGLKNLNPGCIPVLSDVISEDGGLGVVVSHFSGAVRPESLQYVISPDLMLNDNYMVIVNHDALNPQKIRINFKTGYEVDEVTPVAPGQNTYHPSFNTAMTPSITRTLTPGGYLIFHWSNFVKLMDDHTTL